MDTTARLPFHPCCQPCINLTSTTRDLAVIELVKVGTYTEGIGVGLLADLIVEAGLTGAVQVGRSSGHGRGIAGAGSGCPHPDPVRLIATTCGDRRPHLPSPGFPPASRLQFIE